MLMVSSEMGSRPLAVIFTARRAVFIWGDTEAMVPWTMVPGKVLGMICFFDRVCSKGKRGIAGWV